MKFLFVHGLGLSSTIWIPLLSTTHLPSLTLDIPGHGSSNSSDFTWQGIITQILSAVGPDTSDVILVLHSFSSCILPEIISNGLTFRKIILIEALLHPDDSSWTPIIDSFSPTSFTLWHQRFLSVSQMALKRQLVGMHPRQSISDWSASFKQVLPAALFQYSRLCTARLDSGHLLRALEQLARSVYFIRGDRTSLSRTNLEILHSFNINTFNVPFSSHFPMLDNTAYMHFLFRVLKLQ